MSRGAKVSFFTRNVPVFLKIILIRCASFIIALLLLHVNFLNFRFIAFKVMFIFSRTYMFKVIFILTKSTRICQHFIPNIIFRL